ncbi:hypothetical protein [Persicobacter diffluens]|uniref:hypothetical protein n=1 Tax=Persicobacter diffluens TaxID=981 RepID=UPI0030C762CA
MEELNQHIAYEIKELPLPFKALFYIQPYLWTLMFGSDDKGFHSCHSKKCSGKLSKVMPDSLSLQPDSLFLNTPIAVSLEKLRIENIPSIFRNAAKRGFK